MKSIALKTSDVMSRLTIDIQLKGVMELRFRMWLAARIFSLAQYVLGAKINVEVTIT